MNITVIILLSFYNFIHYSFQDQGSIYYDQAAGFLSQSFLKGQAKINIIQNFIYR